MAKDVVTVGEDASLNEVARLMTGRDVSGLPVVDENGRLVGIVSRSDIMAIFARPDESIEHDLRHRLIGQVLAIDPSDVSVSVDEGRVDLAGTVPTKTEARLLENLAGGVDGVMSVDSGLRFRIDDTRLLEVPRHTGYCEPTGAHHSSCR